MVNVVNEVGQVARVGVHVLKCAVAVGGSRTDIQILLLCFAGFVHALRHIRRNKRVVVSVYEKHRYSNIPDRLDRGRLPE